ncbi:MAG: hypothetical protein ACQEQU_03990 [Spirochaetota bacterium]
MKPRSVRFLLLMVLLSIGMISCELWFLPTNWNEIDNLPEADLIPEVAFGDIAIAGRVNVDLSSEVQIANATYNLLGPLLTGFETDSVMKPGDSYSISFYDSQMDFDINYKADEELFHFEGVVADGSGSMNVYYSPVENEFSFDQVIMVNVPDYMDVVVYAEGNNISLDTNGYFHSLYNVAYVSHDLTGSNDWELVSITPEIFRGVLNSAGDTGTGYGYFGDEDSDESTGTRCYFSASAGYDPSEIENAPDFIHQSTLDSWRTYLSSDDVLSLDDDTDSWALFYKADTYSYPSSESYNPGPADYEPYNISDYKSAFSSTDKEIDLSSWGDVSLIVEAMR